jgi:hypothetical protein
VVSKEDAAPGWLLFVSEPIASTLTGAVGQQLQPQDLLQHWQQPGKPGLSAADKYKLSLLHRPGSSQPPPAVSFKDFSSDKADSKAKKAAASTKGFAAAKAASSSSSSGSPSPLPSAAAASTELTQEQLAAVLSVNAYGDDHIDGALALCRAQEQRSIIGERPDGLNDGHVRSCRECWVCASCLLLPRCPLLATTTTPHATSNTPRRRVAGARAPQPLVRAQHGAAGAARRPRAAAYGRGCAGW